MTTSSFQPEDAASHKDEEDLYRLVDDTPPAPPLPGRVIVSPTPDDLIDQIAAEMVVQAELCMRSYGDFHLALAGGPTTQPLYQRLMYDPNYRLLPWRKTHLWFVDERCVPQDHHQSRFPDIHETIGQHSYIPPDHFHAIDAASTQADEEYETYLRETLLQREREQYRLDFVLLTLGVDGHIAGLFPGGESLSETRWICRVGEGGNDQPARISMTLPLLTEARVVAVVTSGADKADIVSRMTQPDVTEDVIPAKGLQLTEGELMWYLDAAACGG